MAANEQTLTDEQFATISANVLHQTLIEVSRTVGKRIVRELEAGKRVALTQLRMEDERSASFGRAARQERCGRSRREERQEGGRGGVTV